MIKLFPGIFILFFMMTTQVAAAGEPLPVFVSILPQQYMVEAIGKTRVDVRVMVLPGASPATYEPKPAQMAALSKARLYFAIGVPFETFWLEKIGSANPKMKLVRTDEGIDKIPMSRHHHGEDSHHEEESHHGHEQSKGLDPHIWLSPELVMVQADHILHALIGEDPGNREFYTQNHAAFLEQVRDLDRELRKLFKEKAGMGFMVFHPSWGYFARDYGLEMIPIEIEGKNPKPGQLKELIHHARDSRIRVIFVQPQFSAKSAALVAREIKGQVMTADPLALDWMTNMKTMAQKFQEALK
jgi:zinc transport system substrate-binding protein